ncbi:glycosyltransferase family 4 protein [Mycolicibacterium bacteremicum]|uniref:glycosyltransferase family 4 protein n=1 Tax=Mycolicibacterium bacteremicum TaxID=564198 RepID=UPI0026E97CA9|nr:glycosyltransferase [Mycolicibacterium bacteremicum]
MTKTMIVHVTESFASGTASAIGDFVRNYPEAEHHLVYTLRPEALVDPRELQQFSSATAMPAGTLARVRFVRNHLRGVRDRFAGTVIVHAHSSKAGAYVRAAVRRSPAMPLVYTPHCYAFERLDLSRPARHVFRAVEWLLSFNTTAYGACSPREAELSRWPGSAQRVHSVPNVTPPGLSGLGGGDVDRPLRIVGNGRLGPQKDPVFFAEAFAAARAENPDIEALWVGGGDEQYVDTLRACGVQVTGWLPRTEALRAMASADLYLHTAGWEGFPISIMEAAGMGLPVVSRRRPYLLGVDLPITIDEPADFASAVGQLRQGDALDKLRRRTQEALADNTDAGQRVALLDLYGPLNGAQR